MKKNNYSGICLLILSSPLAHAKISDHPYHPQPQTAMGSYKNVRSGKTDSVSLLFNWVDYTKNKTLGNGNNLSSSTKKKADIELHGFTLTSGGVKYYYNAQWDSLEVEYPEEKCAKKNTKCRPRSAKKITNCGLESQYDELPTLERTRSLREKFNELFHAAKTGEMPFKDPNWGISDFERRAISPKLQLCSLAIRDFSGLLSGAEYGIRKKEGYYSRSAKYKAFFYAYQVASGLLEKDFRKMKDLRAMLGGSSSPLLSGSGLFSGCGNYTAKHTDQDFNGGYGPWDCLPKGTMLGLPGVFDVRDARETFFILGDTLEQATSGMGAH